MPLTTDPQIDALYADWLGKTAAAALADQALQGAVGNVAAQRQASQTAARAARAAAQALYDRIFNGPALTPQQQVDWVRVGGDQMRQDIDPGKLANAVVSAISDAVAVSAGTPSADEPAKVP